MYIKKIKGIGSNGYWEGPQTSPPVPLCRFLSGVSPLDSPRASCIWPCSALDLTGAPWFFACTTGLGLTCLGKTLSLRASSLLVARSWSSLSFGSSCSRTFWHLRTPSSRSSSTCGADFALLFVEPGLYVQRVPVRGDWLLQPFCLRRGDR